MTRDDFQSLNPKSFYRFDFYWGEKEYGHIIEDGGQYFILKPDQLSKGIEHIDFSKSIRLDTIEHWEKININERNIELQHPIEIKDQYSDILIILGAGASYDFSYNMNLKKEGRPPLTCDLFSDVYTNVISSFPGALSLSSEILKAKNIEEYFQKQWAFVVSTKNKVLLNKLIDTQYYLRQLFQFISFSCVERRKNNYNILIQQLYNSLIEKSSNERSLIVTFNYDTLLEQSITQTINCNFETISDYVDYEKNKLLIFKPHGSWNWGQRINERFFAENNIQQLNSDYLVSNHLYKKSFTLNQMSKYLSERIELYDIDFTHWQNYYFPSLLIPFSKKDQFIMPESHKTTLESFLPNIKKIIVIGWKGTELAFQRLLKKHLHSKEIEVIYVNKKDESFEKEMKPYLPNAIFKSFAPYKESEGTFSELMEYVLENPNILY